MRTFEKIKLAAAIVAGASMIPTSPAFSWTLDFTMVNHTDQPIVALWASPASDDSWEGAASNIFIPDYGGSEKITFSRGASGDNCYYDVRFKFARGTVRTISDVYLCGIRRIYIHVKDGRVVYDTE